MSNNDMFTKAMEMAKAAAMEPDDNKKKQMLREAEAVMLQAAGKSVNGETEVDPSTMPESALLQDKGIYWLAFDVEGPMTSSSNYEGFHTTRGGIFERTSTEDKPYGTFKITQIVENDVWERVKYGDELNKMFDENISGLFVRITDDFGPFATTILHKRIEYDQRIQIWVQVTVPSIRGTIIRSTPFGGSQVQYQYRVQMVGDPVVILPTDPRWIICDDSPVILDNRPVFANLPKVGKDVVAATPENMKLIATNSRARSNTNQEGDQQEGSTRAKAGAAARSIMRPGGKTAEILLKKPKPSTLTSKSVDADDNDPIDNE